MSTPAAGRAFSRRTLLIAGLSATATVLAVGYEVLTRDTTTAKPANPPGAAGFRPAFPSDGLVTNEYAFRNPKAPDAHVSPDWRATSGSLFARAGCGWTGRPDGQSPGPDSAQNTGSSVFRLVTQRRDFGDCTMQAQVRLRPPEQTSRTPQVDWDGAHLWMRYQSPQQLYALSFRRRDGLVAIKRKAPSTGGGAEGEGDYVTLAQGSHAFSYDAWHTVAGTAADTSAGHVRLSLVIDGKTVLEVEDDAPERISAAGGVGLRGDNTELEFRDFTVGAATNG